MVCSVRDLGSSKLACFFLPEFDDGIFVPLSVLPGLARPSTRDLTVAPLDNNLPLLTCSIVIHVTRWDFDSPDNFP